MTSDAARLFVSLELPGVVRDSLTEWARSVGAEGLGLRLLPADALHLTLCFLGSQPMGEIEAIAAACSAASSGRAIPLVLGGARGLPPRRPRVLAVDLEDPGGGLGVLQSTLAQRLAQGGWYKAERRSYLPHVTVARAGRSGLRGPSRPAALPPPEPLSFTADSVVLMRSHLGPGGSRYESLASSALVHRT